MSKSKKNIIDPENIINDFGADAARWFMLSDSPPERDINWSLAGIKGAWRFTQKVWMIVLKNKDVFAGAIKIDDSGLSKEATNFQKSIHANLDEVTKSIEKFQMNVSIAKIYEIANSIGKFNPQNKNESAVLKESLEILIRIIEPMMPHLAEECWLITGHQESIVFQPWPKAEKKLLVKDLATIIIQVNGKKRGEISITLNADEKEVFNKAKQISNVSDLIKNKSILRKIFVPNKILNLVV